MRSRTRCGSDDVFFQQLAVLMTMPGTACIYYGTEIAMPGGHDPDCRRTMPWGQIDAGEHDSAIAETKALIALRNEHLLSAGTDIIWHHDPEQPRLVCYDRPSPDGTLRVYLNAGDRPADLPEQAEICYARRFSGGRLSPGGVLVVRT